jgi:hypothetical protein
MFHIAFIIAFCKMAVVIGSFQIVEFNQLKWVLSPSSISHSEACLFNNLYPTSPSDDISWSPDIMETVTTALGKTVMSKPYGVNGCCVPSLFCEADECFTQSLGSHYFNYESVHSISSHTVYTCNGTSLGDESGRISITKVTAVQGKVSLAGDLFGSDSSLIDATVDGKPCYDKEMCNSACKQCSRFSHSCPKDSVCLTVRDVSSCFMYCGGPTDASCPCGTTCQGVRVYVGDNSYLSTNFCAPKDLDCPSYLEAGQLECMSPRTYSWASDLQPHVHLNISLAVGSDADKTTLSHAPDTCKANQDCFDKSAYSSDSCISGICQYDFAQRSAAETEIMGSTYPAITDRNTRFTYVSFIATGMQAEQDIFEGKVRLDGKLSSVSRVDDAPVDHQELDFAFRYFGNTVEDLNINPNGLISLPPFTECLQLAGTLRVRAVYISLFGHNFLRIMYSALFLEQTPM